MNKKQKGIVTDIRSKEIKLSSDFTSTYPSLAQLLLQAQTIEFTIDGSRRYKQYTWTNSNDETSGWLCLAHHCIPVNKNFIPEHILLSKELGGIVKTWGVGAEDSILSNKNFAFTLEDCLTGIAGHEETYEYLCKEKNFEALDTKDFITFAVDKNGDSTFYNEAKEVFMYLQDGYSDLDSDLVENQPEYTIHKLTTVESFSTYVENLAKEWLNKL